MNAEIRRIGYRPWFGKIELPDTTVTIVYTHGGNMPASLQVTDNACGVIAIWTGSRR